MVVMLVFHWAYYVLYADDLLLLSPSIIGLQRMLDTCSLYGTTQNIMLNKSKTFSVAIGRMSNHNISAVCMDNQPIPRVDHIKYLGVTFDASCSLNMNVVSFRRTLYASLNSLLVRCSTVAEPVEVHHRQPGRLSLVNGVRRSCAET